MSNTYEFTKLSQVEALAEVPENANALVEVEGAIKRVPGSGLGGSASGGGAPFVVNFSVDSDGNISSDKSYEEQFSAYKENKLMVGVLSNGDNDWQQLYVSAACGDYVDFFGILADNEGQLAVSIRTLSIGSIRLYMSDIPLTTE